MPRAKRLHPAAEWIELSTTAADWKAADPGLLATMLGQLHLIRAFEETVLELAGEGLVHGPAHSSIGQEGGAVGSIVSLRSTDAVNGSHRGHHQFLAKAITHVTKGVLDPADLVTPEVADRAAAHAGRDPRARPGLLQRARRLHAPAVVRGRGARHQRHRRGRRADGGGQRLGPEALRHRRPHGHLLRRRRDQHRLGAGEPQPDVRVGAAALLLHREQPLRRLDHRRGGHRGAAAVGARARLRHPGLAGRRHGPARRAPGHGASAAEVAGGRGPGRHRGARLPLLPPERPVPRQRLRLPHQGGRGRVAGPRPAGPRRGRDDQARPHRRGGHRVRARAGAPRHAGGRRRAG